MFVNYLDVHDPYLPPEPYLHRYTKMKHPGGRVSDAWKWFANATPEQRQGAMDAYDGAVNYVDVQIADLLAQLRSRDLLDNTLVVITSDHGESFYEHGFMNHGNSLYRELIHVPLIFIQPGKIPAGKRVAEPVSLTALPATILEQIGDTKDPQFPQLSLASLWNQGEPQDYPAPVAELAQMDWSPKFPNYDGPLVSITTPQWHYIWSARYGEELYRCCEDHPELLNLAETKEGKVACVRLRQELQAATRPVLAAQPQHSHPDSSQAYRPGDPPL